MGMTNRQWQGWLRTIIALLKKMIKEDPDNENLKELFDIFQQMLEDGIN
ncbi:MAG: hypothetical protein IJ679_09100 [Lachnospiraceae bacterium]|nr:hypothetical protein [Lachnospiraceae bacterium]